MVKKCIVPKCTSESYPGCGVSFHGFPKTEEKLEEWLSAIPNKSSINLTSASVICSLHFTLHDYSLITVDKRLLKSTAVPSVFSHGPEFRISPVEQELRRKIKTLIMKLRKRDRKIARLRAILKSANISDTTMNSQEHDENSEESP